MSPIQSGYSAEKTWKTIAANAICLCDTHLAMTAQDSSADWLLKLRQGDGAGAERLWETYYEKLVHLARRKLEGRVRLVGDEEDVALSALKSFCRGIARGRFP